MKVTTGSFIEKAKTRHGDKYDYSNVEYIDARTRVCIICPEHGEFWQTPNSHLNGCGCPKCGTEIVKLKNRVSTDRFIENVKKVHGNKYDYSKVDYINNKTKVCIICPEHGEFWQIPWVHLSGCGCPKCGYEQVSSKKTTINTDEWIRRAKEVHGDRYDYSKTNYNGYFNKVTIICKKHGEFNQLAYNHLQGKGCPKCSLSKMEIDISNFLNENHINFIQQYRPEFLKDNRSYFSLDFYLPDYNIAIECQGEQHFNRNTFYGKNTKNIQKRDLHKNELAKNNGINILYYTNLKLPETYPFEITNDKNVLLMWILKK